MDLACARPVCLFSLRGSGGSVLHAKRGGALKSASLELRLRQEDVLDAGVLGEGQGPGPQAGKGIGAGAKMLHGGALG